MKDKKESEKAGLKLSIQKPKIIISGPIISWLQSPFGVILELKKVKSTTVSAFPPSVRHAVMGPDAMVLGYQKMSFKSAFSLSFFTLIKFLFTFCHK